MMTLSNTLAPAPRCGWRSRRAGGASRTQGQVAVMKIVRVDDCVRGRKMTSRSKVYRSSHYQRRIRRRIDRIVLVSICVQSANALKDSSGSVIQQRETPSEDLSARPKVGRWVIERDAQVMKRIMEPVLIRGANTRPRRQKKRLSKGKRSVSDDSADSDTNTPIGMSQAQLGEHLLTQYCCLRRAEFFPQTPYLYDWEWRAGSDVLNFQGDLLLWDGDHLFIAVELKNIEILNDYDSKHDSIKRYYRNAQSKRKLATRKHKVEAQAKVAQVMAPSYISDVHYKRSFFKTSSNVIHHDNVSKSDSSDVVPTLSTSSTSNNNKPSMITTRDDDESDGRLHRIPNVYGVAFTNSFYKEHCTALSREERDRLQLEFSKYWSMIKVKIGKNGKASVSKRIEALNCIRLCQKEYENDDDKSNNDEEVDDVLKTFKLPARVGLIKSLPDLAKGYNYSMHYYQCRPPEQNF